MSAFCTKWKFVPWALAATLLAIPVFAQSTGTSASTTNSTSSPSAPATIKDRRENQQDRIAQGVKSGQLTPGETANLETKEAALNGEIAADRKANGGTLTQPEKQQINQQENQLSKQIAADKHNDATDHFGNSEIGQREENQQDRIAQGIKSGQLTPGETAKLETNEAAINQQVRDDRQANGGKLTPAEKKQINKEQNRQSRNINRARHNGRRGPH